MLVINTLLKMQPFPHTLRVFSVYIAHESTTAVGLASFHRTQQHLMRRYPRGSLAKSVFLSLNTKYGIVE